MRDLAPRVVGGIIAAVLAATAVVLPVASAPPAESRPIVFEQSDVACPFTGVIGQRESRISVGAAVDESRLLAFAAGQEVGTSTVEGPEAVAFRDLTEVGVAPVLALLPEGDGGATVLNAGQSTLSATACAAPSSGPIVAAGGSNAEGEVTELMLVNPYAVDAEVEVIIVSEQGAEAGQSLDTVVIRPRSHLTIDLTRTYSGRLRVAAVVVPREGHVVAALRWSGSGDIAESTAVAPATDWFVVVPGVDEGVARELVLHGVEATEVPVQVTVVGGDGESSTSDLAIPARGDIVFELDQGGGEPAGVIVRAGASVTAHVRIAGDDVRAVAPGAAEAATTWLVHGVGLDIDGVTDHLVVFVPGAEDAEVTIAEAGPDGATNEVSVAAGSVVAVELDVPGPLVEVTAAVPFVVGHVLERDGGIGLDLGIPVQAGGD